MSKIIEIPTSELEKKLLEYKQEFQSLADDSNVAIATTDMKGKFTYVNKILIELLGYSAQELLGTPFKNYLHPSDRGQIIALFLNIMVLKRQPRNFEFKALHKDGTIRYLLSKPSKLIINGKTIGFLAIILDITEQKKIEQELKQSEIRNKKTSEFLNNILLNMVDYVFVICEDYTIRYLNESAKSVYGNLIGQKCYKGTRNLDQPCHNSGIPCEIYEIIEKGKDTFEDTRKMDLNERIAHVRAKPIVTSEGKKAIIVVVRDVTEEKSSKEELGKSFALLRATLESTADGILAVDLNENITGYNRRFVEILKIPMSVLETKNDRDIVAYLNNYVKNPVGFEKRVKELRSKADVETLDLLEFIDGRIIERYSRPQNIEGKVIGRVISFRDMTDRIAAENALRESKEFCSSLLENSAYPIMVANPDTSLRYVNPALEKLTGFSLSEISGKKAPYPWWPNDEGEDMQKNLIEHMDYGARDDECCFLKKSGEKFWVEVNGTPVKANDKLKYYLANWVNITDHKCMEEELKQYSAHLGDLVNKKTNELARASLFLHSTIDVVPDLMYVKDENYRYVYVNNSYCKFHGKSREKILGGTVYDLYVKKEADTFTEQDRIVFENGKPLLTPDISLIDADGSTHIIQTIKTPIIDEKGNLTHLIGITRDVTERKQLEKMKDQFISAVTHELRTPLVSIKAYVDYPLTGKMGKISSKLLSNLVIVKRNTDRLLNLTDDLLDIRRIESGKLKLNNEKLEFQEIVENCVEEIKPLIKEKRQKIKVEIPKNSLIVEGDKIRLSQILMNLLSNANKFTPDGGKIILNVKASQTKIKVELSDTGIGINKQELDRVFEPFASIKKPTYFKGTGLGLNVTKGLIKAHGGKIWVKSKGEGKGSTFMFELPKIS